MKCVWVAMILVMALVGVVRAEDVGKPLIILDGSGGFLGCVAFLGGFWYRSH